MISDKYGDLPASKFSSVELEETQSRAVSGGSLARKTINKRIGYIRHIFKWGGKKKLVSPTVYHELLLVDGLKLGRTTAREYEDVTEVPLEWVIKTLPKCPPMIADMVRLQLLAGMRPGEVCTLRPCDIDRSDDIWVYNKKDHKMAHTGRKKEIVLNYHCQAILVPYLMDIVDTPEAYVFSAKRSVADQNAAKRAKRKSNVQPSQVDRSKPHPMIKPNDRYEVSSYRTAIQRAAKRARVPQWFPNQLRHLRGGDIREKHGLDGVQAILGHANAKTSEIYAEIKLKQAKDIARNDDFYIE